MISKEKIQVPPDGGWGWIVCFAYALNNIIVVPIMQTFGLVFSQRFKELGLSATDATVIINTNSAFGMMMGLVNGSLLKKFGYRSMAILGGLLVAFGYVTTAFAESFQFFVISYGLITSLGFGLTMAAFSLALNSFFQKNRGKATGFAMTGTGIGPIIMPLFVSYLLSEFGTTGCALIIGGMAFNTVAAGLLLQPIKWHMKTIIPDVELQPLDDKEKNELIIKNGTTGNGITDKNSLNSSILSIDHDVETQSIYGFETPIPIRKISSASYDASAGRQRIRTISRSLSQTPHVEKQSTLSINSMNSLKSIKEEEEKILEKKPVITESKSEKKEKPIKKKSFLRRLANFFDLDLLKDPIYLNLMFGMSLAVFAEINFSLLMPFILNDFNFPNFQIAQIMSTIAATDIVFRFCAPFVADWMKIAPKFMYMFSLILLIICRTVLIFAKTFFAMIFVAIILGVAKGFRTVFMSLLIPTYVPIDKLASALGLQMVVNGVINMIGGPLLGVIRDFTGSYDKCIIVINSVTGVTLLMWTIEFIYFRYFKNSR